VEDWIDARLIGVGAFAIAASRIAVLRVVVVGSGLRIGILDLVARWGGRVSLGILVVGHIARTQHNVVRPSSTHDRLMIIIADSVVIADELEIGGIACTHVVIPHVEGTLVNRPRRNFTIIVTCGLMYPGVQIV